MNTLNYLHVMKIFKIINNKQYDLKLILNDDIIQTLSTFELFKIEYFKTLQLIYNCKLIIYNDVGIASDLDHLYHYSISDLQNVVEMYSAYLRFKYDII